MYLLVMVLDNVSQLNDVLNAWTNAGVPGITILESTGVNRVLQRQMPEAAFAGFSQIFGSGRVGHNTIFSVIGNLDLAQQAVTETEKVVGSLHEPHTGIVFALPLAQMWGKLDKVLG
jgi:nitrogen regulatory protein P-II 1